MMFLDCPACLDQDGALRCGLPAEVRCRFTMRSTDGPVESAMIRCPAGPGDLVTPPASAVPRSHHVGLLWAAWAMITPGHGQSRTKASRSGPADLPRPGQKGVIRPLPAHTSGGGTLPGPESLAGGRPDLRASISVKPSGGGT